MFLSAAGLALNEYQHVPLCHVSSHSANSFSTDHKGLFAADSSNMTFLSVYLPVGQSIHSLTLNVAETFRHVTELMEALIEFLFLLGE